MSKPLMPKATAVWLIDNTTLTFKQIANFCGLHSLEVQGIADEEVAIGIVGASPVDAGELTEEEITRCQNDDSAQLIMAKGELPVPVARAKGPRYTPVSKRQDRPDAIAWLLTQHPELGDAQISRLVGTTKPTISAIRERTHWNMQNLKPQSPVKLGLCTQAELVSDLAKAERAAARRAKREAAAKKASKKLIASEPMAGKILVTEAALSPGESAVSPTSEAPPVHPSEWHAHLPTTNTVKPEEASVEVGEVESANEKEEQTKEDD